MSQEPTAGSKKVVIVGGGPGGYVAALRAAQLGLSVILVERDEVGGTCLNRGCIPTKALLKTAEALDLVRKAADVGIDVQGFQVNLDKIRERKSSVVQGLVKGVRYLLGAKKVRLVKGEARLIEGGLVEVSAAGGTCERLSSDAVILATGSMASVPPVEGADLPGIIGSDEALELRDVPERLLIVGGGAIGVEMATVYASLGSKVTIVEMMEQILPDLDVDLVGVLERELKGRGIEILTRSRVQRISAAPGGGLEVELQTPRGSVKQAASKVLMAAGRRPNTAGLGLESVPLKLDREWIKVDERMRTGVPGLYAIGDVTGGALLAHVASAQGVVAAEDIAGHSSRMSYEAIPSCIYTSPEIASVGLTEKEAAARGKAVKIAKFPFLANGKALTMGEREGFVKVIAGEKYGEILGVHIVGPHATDLIGEALLALKLEATWEDIGHAIHPHPTLTEALMEACLAAGGEAIHIP